MSEEYLKSTICPICEKETKGTIPHYFRRKGELYRVHKGKCTTDFLNCELKERPKKKVK